MSEEMRIICGCGHRLAVYSIGNKKVKDILCHCCRNRINGQLEQSLVGQGWKLVDGEWMHNLEETV